MAELVLRKAVVLLSGGLDSATTAAIASEAGYSLYCLTFNYGQRHKVELESAARVALHIGAKDHLVIDTDFRRMGGSALTDEIDVPKFEEAQGGSSGVPITYVPARNTIFLSYALGWAEVVGARDIFIGATAVDFSGYPDCRPEFISAFQNLANVATKVGVEGGEIRIHAPIIQMTKGEIIARGLELGVDYSLTHSCYDPSAEGLACGHCDTCLLRLKGFEALGIEDPGRYQ